MSADTPPDGVSPTATAGLRRAKRKAAKRLRARQRSIAKEERARRSERDGTAVWRQQIGSLTFFNGGPKRPPVVEDVPLTTEVLRGAFVLCQVSIDAARLPGAVCRNDGTIADVVTNKANRTGRIPDRAVIEPARLAAATAIDETAIYLGKLKHHFGHFLLESLARAWYLGESGARPLLVFHSDGHAFAELGSFAHAVFRALDVDPSRIIVVHEDLRFRELILPSPQYTNVVKGSPGICVVFDRIRDRIMRTLPSRDRTPGKVYFTRRNLSPLAFNGQPRSFFRNEDEAEAIFRAHGFEIVSPETLPFEEQVAIAANATHVAGLAGSALHLILFNDRPGTKVIELRTRSTQNQMIINTIKGVDAFHIWCAAHRTESTTVLDIDVIERAMREIQ